MSTPLQGWIRGLRALPSPTHASLTSPPIGWPRALLLSPTSATTPTTSWCRCRKAVRVAAAYSLLGRTGASTCPSPFSPAPALSSEDELERELRVSSGNRRSSFKWTVSAFNKGRFKKKKHCGLDGRPPSNQHFCHLNIAIGL